jgi:hypothetical protein
VTFRNKLRDFAGAADKVAGGGDKFSRIAALLGEVHTYETQLDEALRLGYQEQAAAQQAASDRRDVGGGPGATPNDPRQGGQPYYEPYSFFHSNGGRSYECMKHEVNLPAQLRTGGSGKESTVNMHVDEAIKALQGFRKEVDPMRQALASAMDLTMNNPMPIAATGRAPTSRSAVQDL